MTKKTLAVSVWWLGVVISVIAVLVHPHRHGAIDWSLDSPFDNTRSGQAEQWIFLSQAARHLPRGASFTILAPDRDTEMSLFMMAVGLLPEASPMPSSYYGQSTATGEQARFVLEFGATGSLRPLETHPIAITGGRLTERCANGPRRASCSSQPFSGPRPSSVSRSPFTRASDSSLSRPKCRWHGSRGP